MSLLFIIVAPELSKGPQQALGSQYIERGDWEVGVAVDRNGGSQTGWLVCPEDDRLHLEE